MILAREELPALTRRSISDSGQSNTGNNDAGRRLRANRARTCWRILWPDGSRTHTGLFVDRDAASAYCLDRGWSVPA